MEEQQIQEFIHKALADEAVRAELASDAAGVIRREGFSPRVERILSRLMPYLAFDGPLESDEKWWHA
jgi:hypothetical protein